MAKSNASSHKLYFVEAGQDRLVIHLTNFDLSGDREDIDYTTKDNNGFRDFEPGLGSYEISMEGFVDFQPGTNNRNINEIIAAYRNKTLIAFKIKNSTTGDTTHTGSGYFMSFEQGSPMEDALAFSATLAVKGDIGVTVTS